MVSSQKAIKNQITEKLYGGDRDNESWINHFRDYNQKYTDRPLLFDKNGNKKKEYREIKNSIQAD